MLRATFCHIEGIGLRAEQRLWTSGVTDWKRFCRLRPAFLSPEVHFAACGEIETSEFHLEHQQPQYFLDHLPGLHKVRLLREFRSSVAFLDVETTGLDPSSQVTTVALCMEGSLSMFVRGRNLDVLGQALGGARVIVTYNGENFDLPTLRQHLRLTLRQPHLDLYPLMRAAGYRGGLKKCEKLARVQRRTSSRMNGSMAANLWDTFLRTGDHRALKLLLAYNSDDALSLRTLASKLYARSMEMYPRRVTLTFPACATAEYDPAWESLFFDR